MLIPRDVILRDAEMKARSYHGMSREYAASGHSWLAVHTQLASDLAAATYAAVETGGAVTAGLADTISGLDLTDLTARDATYKAREVVADSLGDIAFAVWRETVSGLEHLDPLTTVDATLLATGLEERFGQGTVEEYIWQRLSDAESGNLRVQELLTQVPQTETTVVDAIEAQYDADIASFEAWLLQRSLSIQDRTLTQYEILWSLGMAAIASLPPLPDDHTEARHQVLSRLAWAVGPEEAPTLLTYILEPSSVAL